MISPGAGFSTTICWSSAIAMLVLNLRVGVAQRRQVSGARPRVQVGQHAVIPLLGFHLRCPAVGVVDVAEDDHLGRAGVLTGCLYLAILHFAILLFGVDLGRIDALHAVSTLRSEERRVGKECRSRW